MPKKCRYDAMNFPVVGDGPNYTAISVKSRQPQVYIVRKSDAT